jgi:nonsense-mediated mRNA decay protein 3
MTGLICPKCGRSDEKIKFIDAFCTDCYPIKIELPGKMGFERCGRCSRMKFRGEWMAYNERKLKEYILGKCKGDFESADYDIESQMAFFMIRGSKIERFLPVDFIKTICQQCSRISGGYYEGIIQLRGNRAKMEKYADMLMGKLERITFITKTEEKEEGLDLYVGRSKPVVKLMSDLGLKTLMTKKLVGRDQGKRLYRTTFLIRLE